MEKIENPLKTINILQILYFAMMVLQEITLIYHDVALGLVNYTGYGIYDHLDFNDVIIRILHFATSISIPAYVWRRTYVRYKQKNCNVSDTTGYLKKSLLYYSIRRRP